MWYVVALVFLAVGIWWIAEKRSQWRDVRETLRMIRARSREEQERSRPPR